jgi:hypothetical protein
MSASHSHWEYSTPIDTWEDWDASRVDGRSDVNNHFLSIVRGGTQVDDVLLITMMMYMPSGDTPYLALGRWPTGAPSFIDETSQWASLPDFRANDIYVRSWWKRADLDTINNGGVNVDLYNFDAPIGSPNPGSTEGGTLFMNIFRSDGDPEIAYQQGSVSDMPVTPDPGTEAILHQFFAQRSFVIDESIHGVVAVTPGYPTGYEGTGSTARPWMTTALEDNGVWNAALGGFDNQDLYAIGFYWGGDALGAIGSDYGPVTWDLSTPGPFAEAFGPAGAIQQGIKFLDGGPIITFV